jgi:hypothetical protein
MVMIFPKNNSINKYPLERSIVFADRVTSDTISFLFTPEGWKF